VEADYGESSRGIGFGVGLDTRLVDGLATGLDDLKKNRFPELGSTTASISHDL